MNAAARCSATASAAAACDAWWSGAKRRAAAAAAALSSSSVVAASSLSASSYSLRYRAQRLPCRYSAHASGAGSPAFRLSFVSSATK